MQKKMEYHISKNHDLSMNFFGSNFIDVLKKDSALTKKIDIFMRNINNKYHPNEANLIRRALVIGTVAHQKNENEKKRYRKAKSGGSEPTAYFIHPIEMAEKMIEGLTFDWITIVATLLHDVSEDVKLSGIEGREAWLSNITELYKDTGYQYLLASIIDGVTERKIFSNKSNYREEVKYERLKKTPMYKMIESYIERGGVRHMNSEKKEVYLEDKREIMEVVYNLEHLFLSATETPEDLRIFFIKIADVWHNLQSPEWIKDIKVLRGRIAASLADLLGWDSMRDDIIISLSKITDVTTPFSPHVNKNKKLFDEKFRPDLEAEIVEDTKLAKQAVTELLSRYKITPIVFRPGFPIPHSDTKNPLFTLYDREKTTLPQPQINVSISSDFVNFFKNDFSRFFVSIVDYRNKYGKTNVTIKKIYSLNEETLNLLGRKQMIVIIKPGNNNSFTVRIENDRPHIIDLFSNERKVTDLSQIPELGLFLSSSIKNQDILNTHIQSLIGFCYEPNMIGQIGENVVPIFDKSTNRLLFLPSQLTVNEAKETCDIGKLNEKLSGQALWGYYETRNIRKPALGRIIIV